MLIKQLSFKSQTGQDLNAITSGVGNPATTPQTGIYTLEIPDYTNTTTVKVVKISGAYIPQGGAVLNKLIQFTL